MSVSAGRFRSWKNVCARALNAGFAHFLESHVAWGLRKRMHVRLFFCACGCVSRNEYAMSVWFVKNWASVWFDKITLFFTVTVISAYGLGMRRASRFRTSPAYWCCAVLSGVLITSVGGTAASALLLWRAVRRVCAKALLNPEVEVSVDC